jgi:two-component system KDP operon response regulator KdpE
MTTPVQPVVLVVDDEPQIQRFLGPALTAAGYRVIAASTAAQAVRLALTGGPAAVILDLGLPDRDGKEVIEAIRRESDVPIVVLSARDREAEKIATLDLGANDFVNKPFGIGELLARLRVVTRPRGPLADPVTVLTSDELTLDIAAHKVMLAGEQVHLTPKEFDLLATLMRHPGRVLTHRHVLNALWGPAHVADTQYLRVFIGQLRQKIEPDPAEPHWIFTEPGVGYRFRD